MKSAYFALLSLVLIACDDSPSKQEEAPAPAASGSESPAAAEAPTPTSETADASPELAPESPTTELGDIPTFEDLELEASKTIVVQNLEAELDRLEAEIVELPN